PVHKGPLGIHQVELVVQSSPGLCNSCGVTQHADCTLDFGQVASRYNSGWLVVDANLRNQDTSWAPVHKLNCTLGLDGCNSGIDIFGHNIPTVQHAAGHVFAVSGITLDHLVSRLKAGIGD
ncbi:hypothetical protein EGW08_020688, partial [Elysia chlorotica]